MTEPTTPQVSPARREAIAKAISGALPPYMQARGVLDPTGKTPHWWPEGAGVQALVDAALAALLPDIDAMQKRIAEALYCAYQTENGICDRYAFYEGSILYEDAMQDAHALIYGEEERE